MYQESYLQKSLEQIPRILSIEDRESTSLTYGCFDRRWWAWKFKDFPDATLQRAVYLLSLVFQNKFNNNIYFHNKHIGQWIKAGILYWLKIQHQNGSYDQAFPYEFSFGATAFTLGPLIKSFLITQNYFSSQEKNQILQGFTKAANFLVRHNELHGLISNHLAGAAISLSLASDLLNNPAYQKKSQKIVNYIIENQSPDGWFHEYGGPDPGYETLGIYYLSQYWQRRHDEPLLKALKKSINFLSYFLHPDGSYGGEYGSRNTEIFYPAGFKILEKDIPMAQIISQRVIQTVHRGKTIIPTYLDTENLIPLIENYLESGLINHPAAEQQKKFLPFEKKNINIFFKHSMILAMGNSSYYLICNAKKGGVIKIFDKSQQRLVYDDSGYFGQIDHGQCLTTQIANQTAKVKIRMNHLSITTNFFKAPQQLITPLNLIILRIFNLSLGRNIFLGNFLKKQLVKTLISRQKKYPITLNRQINFKENNITIKDIIQKQPNTKFHWLIYGQKFSAIHMGSAKYFQKQQLQNKIAPEPINLEKLNQKNSLVIFNKITLC